METVRNEAEHYQCLTQSQYLCVPSCSSITLDLK